MFIIDDMNTQTEGHDKKNNFQFCLVLKVPKVRTLVTNNSLILLIFFTISWGKKK